MPTWLLAGTGKELAQRDDFSIGAGGEPFAPGDEGIVEVTEMGDGPPERHKAQLQKCNEDLAGGTGSVRR